MSNKLTIIKQLDVNFYDDILIAIKADDGNIYASIRQMCEALGIDIQAQRRRIGRHSVLSDGFMIANLATIKGKRPTNVLRVDLIPFWLSGVRAKSVNDDVRPKLELLQRQAAKVLWEAFQDGRLSIDPAFSELLKNADSPSVQAYKMAQAIMQMAQQQIILEGRVALHDHKFIEHGQKLDEHEDRIEQIESIIGDNKHNITPSQASQISQAVKAIALVMGKRTERNEYGGVYGELYRRFEITSYKQLPKNRFDEALKFLTDWYAQITGGRDVPF